MGFAERKKWTLHLKDLGLTGLDFSDYGKAAGPEGSTCQLRQCQAGHTVEPGNPKGRRGQNPQETERILNTLSYRWARGMKNHRYFPQETNF